MIIFMLVSLLFGYVYEDSDSLIVYNDSLVICGNHQYNIKVHIANNGKLKIRPWRYPPTDSIGWLFLNAPLILVEGSSLIMGSEAGYGGGSTSSHPSGYGPGGGSAVAASGGGGAGYGGDGGNGGGNPGGAGGSTYGNPTDTLIDMGSGGGAGYVPFLDGLGGDGGAFISLQAQKIIIDVSTIEVNGQNGYNGTAYAGGAGSGGGIIIRTDSSVIHNSTISTNGGNGGNASTGGGGGGGGGRIKIFCTANLDTTAMNLSVQGGVAGNGSTGNPQPGVNGTIYIQPIVCILEGVNTPHMRFTIQSTVVRNSVKIMVNDPPLFVVLYDISGRIAKAFSLKNNTEIISLSDLRQGVYFLKSDDAHSPVGKIILLK